MRLFERLIHFIGQQAGWLYVAVVLLTLFETLMRSAFNAPTIWVLELSLMLSGIAYLLNGASFDQTSGHIRIDIFYRKLTGARKIAADILTFLIGAGYLITVTIWGARQAIDSIGYGERSGSTWNSILPMAHKSAIPIAALLMLFALISKFLRSLREPNEVDTQ